MMKTIALVVLMFLATPALAQNPCTTPSTNSILGPTGFNRVWVELPQHLETLPDGSDVVTAYQFGVWPDGADPNAAPAMQGPSTLPKASFVAVPTFPNCYELTGGFPGLIPTQARAIAGLRVMGVTESSSWASSNSFSLASTPVKPAAPGQLRIRP